MYTYYNMIAIFIQFELIKLHILIVLYMNTLTV